MLTPSLAPLTILPLSPTAEAGGGRSWGAVGKNQTRFWEPSIYPRTPLDEPTVLVDQNFFLLCIQQPLLHSLKSSSKSIMTCPLPSPDEQRKKSGYRRSPCPGAVGALTGAPSSWSRKRAGGELLGLQPLWPWWPQGTADSEQVAQPTASGSCIWLRSPKRT